MQLAGEHNDALIVGGSRGIGRAIVSRLQGQKWRRIYVASRNVDELAAAEHQLVPVALDITSEDSLAKAAAILSDQGASLSLICCTVGMLHTPELKPEKALKDCSVEQLQQNFAVNSIGPLMVAKYFSPFLSRSDEAVLASFSARVGSIDDNGLGGWYGYRASKAAQNMFTRNVAIELGRRRKQLACIAYHPGTVDTDLSKPFASNVSAESLFDTGQAADYFLALLENLTPEDSGKFFAWDGQTIRW